MKYVNKNFEGTGTIVRRLINQKFILPKFGKTIHVKKESVHPEKTTPPTFFIDKVNPRLL